MLRGEHLALADLPSDHGDAIALLGEAWRAYGDEVTAASCDDLFRRSIRTLQMMNVADDLALLYFCAEIDRDFKDAGFWRENVVLAIRGLRDDRRGFALLFAVSYVLLYRRLAQFKAPKWMRVSGGR
jgi:hypothetical protein